jgi:hypothetical protein
MKNMETINIGTIKTWNIEAMTGYKPRTTFYEDFSKSVQRMAEQH